MKVQGRSEGSVEACAERSCKPRNLIRLPARCPVNEKDLIDGGLRIPAELRCSLEAILNRLQEPTFEK
jgi:hypothetical protein